jgi:hypothetical protein
LEFKGMGIVTFQTTPTYAIELGKILEIKNVS